jgi:hypothetical protein
VLAVAQLRLQEGGPSALPLLPDRLLTLGSRWMGLRRALRKHRTRIGIFRLPIESQRVSWLIEKRYVDIGFQTYNSHANPRFGDINQ